MNENIRQYSNIQSNWEYRKYMTENANSIIDYNQLSSCEGGSPYTGIQQQGIAQNKKTPYFYKSTTDKSQPVGYETSDLKEAYLSRSMLFARLVSPTVEPSKMK